MYYSFCGVILYTSSFDIVGPYFASEGPMKAKFVMARVLESISGKILHFFLHELPGHLQIHGLKTSLLVCDGGALNQAALNSTHGYFVA